MRKWIDKCCLCKAFVTNWNHGSQVSRVTSYDPRRRPDRDGSRGNDVDRDCRHAGHVWAVLSDLASYPRWHPVFLSVTGQLAAGSTLTITTTHPTSGRTITGKVKVLTVEPGTELRWVSKLPE